MTNPAAGLDVHRLMADATQLFTRKSETFRNDPRGSRGGLVP